jgi:sulfite dehydrogenase
VEISGDGATWQAAKLGRDLGRFSFREFSLTLPARDRGALVVMARATALSGETQVEQLIHNPAGYHHNVIQRIYLEVV